LEKKNQIIEQEQKRSDELLLNILPAATAEELKQHGKTKAKFYDSVTVLFTDFESFTKISERLSPEELVSELDSCFQAFDRITTKYGIEKIKTIGDSYMCAGGLPTPNHSHPKDVVNAAIEMHEFLEQLAIKHVRKMKPVFKARIGIHTGPVVAGIVGSKKFAYDIWGDTVNTASRMESSGEIGRINISQSTYELVKEDFNCLHRGKIKAKKKGVVDMYFIETKVLSPNHI
jgi:class 3 adenylate cyclase